MVFGGEVVGGRDAVGEAHLVDPAGPGAVARSVAVAARQVAEAERGVVVRHGDDRRRPDQGAVLVDAAGRAVVDEHEVAPDVPKRGPEVELGGGCAGTERSDVVGRSIVGDLDREGAVGRAFVVCFLPLADKFVVVVVEVLVLEPAGDDERVAEVERRAGAGIGDKHAAELVAFALLRGGGADHDRLAKHAFLVRDGRLRLFAVDSDGGGGVRVGAVGARGVGVAQVPDAGVAAPDLRRGGAGVGERGAVARLDGGALRIGGDLHPHDRNTVRVPCVELPRQQVAAFVDELEARLRDVGVMESVDTRLGEAERNRNAGGGRPGVGDRRREVLVGGGRLLRERDVEARAAALRRVGGAVQGGGRPRVPDVGSDVQPGRRPGERPVGGERPERELRQGREIGAVEDGDGRRGGEVHERNGECRVGTGDRGGGRADARGVGIGQLGRAERREGGGVGDRVVLRPDPVARGESVEDAQLVHVAAEAIVGRIVPEGSEGPIREGRVGIHEAVRAVRLVVLDAVEVGDEPRAGPVVGKGDVAPGPRGEARARQVGARRPGVAALVGDGKARPRLGQHHEALAVGVPRLAVAHEDVGAVVVLAAVSVAIEPAGDGEAAGVRKLRRRLVDVDAHGVVGGLADSAAGLSGGRVRRDGRRAGGDREAVADGVRQRVAAVDHDRVARPDVGRVDGGQRGGVRPVEQVERRRRSREGRNLDPDVGHAARIPRLDLVREHRAVRGREAQVRAVRRTVAVVEAGGLARREPHEDREVCQRLRPRVAGNRDRDALREASRSDHVARPERGHGRFGPVDAVARDDLPPVGRGGIEAGEGRRVGSRRKRRAECVRRRCRKRGVGPVDESRLGAPALADIQRPRCRERILPDDVVARRGDGDQVRVDEQSDFPGDCIHLHGGQRRVVDAQVVDEAAVLHLAGLIGAETFAELHSAGAARCVAQGELGCVGDQIAVHVKARAGQLRDDGDEVKGRVAIREGCIQKLCRGGFLGAQSDDERTRLGAAANHQVFFRRFATDVQRDAVRPRAERHHRRDGESSPGRRVFAVGRRVRRESVGVERPAVRHAGRIRCSSLVGERDGGRALVRRGEARGAGLGLEVPPDRGHEAGGVRVRRADGRRGERGEDEKREDGAVHANLNGSTV